MRARGCCRSGRWIGSVLIDGGRRRFIRTDPKLDVTRLEFDGEEKSQLDSQTSGMKRTLLSTCAQTGHHPTAFLAGELWSV